VLLLLLLMMMMMMMMMVIDSSIVSWTAALSLMKFCTNMYLDNLWKHIEYQGQGRWVFVCALCA